MKMKSNQKVEKSSMRMVKVKAPQTWMEFLERLDEIIERKSKEANARREAKACLKT
jgi:hypothetical protein